MHSLREQYFAHQKKLTHLAHIQGLLSRDQEAMMPVKAGEWRAEQIGYVAGLLYEMSIDPAYQEILATIDTSVLEPRQQRSIQLAKKELAQSLRVEKQFVEQFEMTKSRAQQVRTEARKTNDFSLFAPLLQEVITLSKQYATAIAPDNQPYDTLLDIYEEGATQERYDALLVPLQAPLTVLLKKNQSQPLLETGAKRLTKNETQALLHELCKTVGFDFDSGMLGEVHHPFMTTLGAYDYRINTRYNDPIEAITGMIHELGHGLYEQQQDPIFHYTNLHGAGMGLHESQSRTLENMIGRSSGMSKYLHTLSKKYWAEYAWTPEKRYAVCNDVHPSLIRIEADEISYGLHILLRYELEKALIGGSLQVKDLPWVWNEKMEQYVGIRPTTDTQGCLQDVHRSCWLFGYFPTYLLWNLYAGQLRDSFTTTHPEREKQVATGDFTAYFNRYHTHIWTHGRSIHPQTLIQNVTGKPLESTYFLNYLTKKFYK